MAVSYGVIRVQGAQMECSRKQFTQICSKFKLIVNSSMNNFCTGCRGILQSNYSQGALRMMSGTSIMAKIAMVGLKVDNEVLSIAKG
jgi:N-acetylglutamate synthase/N-acetylornithine aminotransferase